VQTPRKKVVTEEDPGTRHVTLILSFAFTNTSFTQTHTLKKKKEKKKKTRCVFMFHGDFP